MQRAPGQKLLALARRVLSRDETDRVIEPAIADLQHEWRASDDSHFRPRVSIRGRAYAAALFVVSRHLLVGAARTSFTPPPWAIVRRVIVSSVVLLDVTIGVRLFLETPRGGGAWLLDAGQAVPAAAVKQQTLTELMHVMWSGPPALEAFELHRRLIVMAVAAVAGMLAWIALRQRQNGPAEPSFLAHFARGLVLAVTAIAIAAACEPAMGPIASEWIGVAIAAAGAACILAALRLAERLPREPVEPDA